MYSAFAYVHSYCCVGIIVPFALQCIAYICSFALYTYACVHALHRLNVVALCTLLTAALNVSLELQGHCSDQLTLICRHSDVPSDPSWIHNGTAEGGQLLDTAFPGACTQFRVIQSTE